MRLASLNGIVISKFLNDALKAHLEQFEDPELTRITQEIKDLNDKVQMLECRRQSIATRNLNFRAWKKVLSKHDLFAVWKRDYMEAKRHNDQAAFEKLLAQIIRITGIPRDNLPLILDDVTSRVTS